MLNTPEMAIAWIDGRIRLLDLIEARLEKSSKADVVVERCRHWDAQLRKLVVQEIERIKEAPAKGQKGGDADG